MPASAISPRSPMATRRRRRAAVRSRHGRSGRRCVSIAACSPKPALSRPYPSGMTKLAADEKVLTLDGAKRAAAADARGHGEGAAIAVVDDGGDLLYLERLDGTFAAGARISIGKARTAALFKRDL